MSNYQILSLNFHLFFYLELTRLKTPERFKLFHKLISARLGQPFAIN